MVLVLVGGAALAALLAFGAGVVALVGLPRNVTRAVRFGWINLAVGAAAVLGAVVAVPRSADGWKLVPAGLLPGILGVVLLLRSRQPVRGNRRR